MAELKDILKKLRPKHGSQVEVAGMLGIKSQQLSQYEGGTRNPKLGFYRKWKTQFGEDLAAMMDEANVSHETINNTSVHKRSDNKEKPLGGDPEVYRTIVEGNTEYVLIPREVMRDSKLIAIDQFTETIEMMKSDRRIMEILVNKFVDAAERLMRPAEPVQPQKGKHHS